MDNIIQGVACCRLPGLKKSPHIHTKTPAFNSVLCIAGCAGGAPGCLAGKPDKYERQRHKKGVLRRIPGRPIGAEGCIRSVHS
jgi:hypothetical protein